ncbi:MAG: exodeoxyribonuclease VII small subunit [Bacteroidales bacterium]|jgi:exodeoxyribonuclease VII small subunit|nr:exodeoxyribonuclease VII small subunit [Bacteroidales bacterium]MCI1784581.1 exodeoxyribonuclease VII small subunit [Bacteroidales bacterium]
MDKNKSTKSKKFDYTGSIAELEAIAKKIESPDTGIDEIAEYVKKSETIVRACRKYLRTLQDSMDETLEDAKPDDI